VAAISRGTMMRATIEAMIKKEVMMTIEIVIVINAMEIMTIDTDKIVH